MPPDTQLALTRREMFAWFARAAALAGVPMGSLALGDARAKAVGYGRDPNLLDPLRTWPLTLTSAQREIAARAADLVLPADAHGPAPSTIGIVEFIDEWVSAPYPRQREDREAIVSGLERLQEKPDASILSDEAFLATFGRLCLLGYYTSAAGMQDIGCVVPAPAAEFTGPPGAIRRQLAVYLSYKQQND